MTDSCSWVIRVVLHLPTPDEMPDEMLEVAAAIAWANYRVEGRGCLWLLVNPKSEPGFMYLPDVKLRRTTGEQCHPDVDDYDPATELLLLVTPNWEVFAPELIGGNQTHFEYRLDLLKRLGKRSEECWLTWGEQLGEVEREGMLTRESREASN